MFTIVACLLLKQSNPGKVGKVKWENLWVPLNGFLTIVSHHRFWLCTSDSMFVFVWSEAFNNQNAMAFRVWKLLLFFFSSNWGVPICLSRDRETQFTGTLFLELCICQSYSLLKDCTLLINPLSQMLVGQYGSLFGLVSAKFIYKCRCSEKSWIYLQDIWFKNRTIPRKYKKWYIIFSKLSCDKWNIIWSMKH